MSETFSIPRTDRYLQLIRRDASAPSTEVAWTNEIDGQKRHGEGRVRKIGPLGLVIGQWKDRDPEQQAVIDGLLEKDEFGVRELTRDEIEGLRAKMQQSNWDQVHTGWVPPLWHWRRYRKPVLTWLSREHLGHGPFLAIDDFGNPRRLYGVSAEQRWQRMVRRVTQR